MIKHLILLGCIVNRAVVMQCKVATLIQCKRSLYILKIIVIKQNTHIVKERSHSTVRYRLYGADSLNLEVN